MGKLIPRLIGFFPKLEGEKNQVGSKAEEENQYKRRERSKWKGSLGTFPSSDTHLLIFSNS